MKLLFSALFFGLISVHANAGESTLVQLEERHVQEIINCPFNSQSKANKDKDKRIVASLTAQKEAEKESKQEVVK